MRRIKDKVGNIIGKRIASVVLKDPVEGAGLPTAQLFLLFDDGTRCLAGKRACPPEDCGGVPGYERLLEVLANPKDEEHDEIVEWLGEEFDPEAFDVDGVNEELKRLR